MAWKKILTHPHTQDWTGDHSGIIGRSNAERDGINRDKLKIDQERSSERVTFGSDREKKEDKKIANKTFFLLAPSSSLVPALLS